MERLTKDSFFITIFEDLKCKFTFSRYNGGWVKEITGINRKKTNGYSLIGDFVENGKEGSYRIDANKLYLDCDIEGSRKNHDKYYVLYSVDTEGNITVYYESPKGGETKTSWVIKIWDICEEFLNKKIDVQETNNPKEELKHLSSSDLYNELQARGYIITIHKKPDEKETSGRFNKIEMD